MKKESPAQKRKGTFGAIRLPIAKQYIFPPSRRRMLIYGAVVALLFGAYFVFTGGLTKGDLSSFHASLERDCAACHTTFRTVATEKCLTCHEKVGDLHGVYTFAAHYLYRSGDVARSSRKHPQEVACFTCHVEHEGRDAEITRVSDGSCASCHGFDSFELEHPQFAALARKLPDDPNLEFPHGMHIREIMERDGLFDREKACLACHHPGADGRNFEPIAFDTACGSCHMSGGTRTAPLPIADPARPFHPGVETLETIRSSRRPDAYWAESVSPAEFRVRGDSVLKTPVRHRDPWVMDNLRRIRRTLYPDEGLQELLDTRGGLPSGDALALTRSMYNEALQKLKSYRDGMSGTSEPALQQELQQVNVLLKTIERKLQDPHSALSPAEFAETPRLNRNVNVGQVEELRNFALDLTQPCRQCHVVTDAAIQRVQKDQRVFRRAHFNHRVHILQRRCLDCHSRIRLPGDRPEVQNLPGIETCRTCHNARSVTQACSACHYFHPNKEQRSGMLLYVDSQVSSR